MGVFGDPASPMAPYGFQSAMYQMSMPQDLAASCLPPLQGAPYDKRAHTVFLPGTVHSTIPYTLM